MTSRLLLCASLLAAAAALAAAAPAPAPTLSAAVDHAVAHLRAECKKQQALMPSLLHAVRNNDLSAARTAYIAARPPYEQIEVQAAAFPGLDADIDARPYAFALGEDSPRFRGFHVIERALFRDDRADHPGLVAVAETLDASVNALCEALTERTRFTPALVVDGALALATEVPAKKISSEEETWSDLSLMIFRNNWQGVWSQVMPFFGTPAVPPAAAAEARLAYAQIKAMYARVDPAHPYNTSAGDARPFSSLSTAERADVQAAAYRFMLAVEAVHAAVVAADPTMPAGEEEAEGGGDAGISAGKYVPQVRAGIKAYAALCATQQTLAAGMLAAIETNDLAAARAAYAKARPPYEQIEVLAGDFETQDGNIDQRPYAVPRGEKDLGWRGMHEVERALYRDHDLGRAASATRVVQRDIDDLCLILGKFAGGGDGPFSADGVFAGMTALSYEVPAKKIASEEETWSDLSIMIFRENAKGIWAVAKPFVTDVLPEKEGSRIRNAYLAIKAYISDVVDKGNDFDNGTDFVPYLKVPVHQRRRISELFYEYGRSIVAAKKVLVDMGK